MGILEKNEKALESFGEEFFLNYRNAKKVQEQRYDIEYTVDHDKVISLSRDGRMWRLNSMYDPERASRLYAERYSRIQDFSVVCIFGLSDGRAVRKLLGNCNETHTVLIYEPDIKIFLTAIEQFPMEDIFQRKNLMLIVGEINENDLQNVLNMIVTYQNHTLMMNCILPNYDLLYQEEGRKYIDRMLYYSKIEVFTKNTELGLGLKLGDNLLQNLSYILQESSVTEFLKYFNKADLRNIPAVIVSAGPSLDKNIKELKKAEGKAFIIGVDSALKALVREKIQFQLAVSVDPGKNPNVFSDERVNKYPYVVSGYSLPLIAEKNSCRLFYTGGYGFESFQKTIKIKTGKVLMDLKTGGSVATDALSLVFNMGFRNVILIGQDLAFTDGKGHVSGFEKSEKEDKEHVEQREKIEVEAIGGGTVLTDIQMDSYRQWFEQHIERMKDKVTVYNATEGGARICGTVETTLKDIIAKLCVKEMDFDRLIAEVPETFTKEERMELAAEFKESLNQIDQLIEKLKNGISLYDQLVEMEENGQQNSSEYRELIQKVYEVNEIEKNEKYMSLIKLYAREEEYKASEDIYAADDLSVQEIAEKGAQMLAGYVNGCLLCKEHIREILIPELDKIIEKCKS